MDAIDRQVEVESVLKDWMMKRNCSVSPRQFWLLYLSLAAFSFTIAGMLLWRGAWLVMPFAGVELLAVGIAFLIYARHAVDYEYVRLCRHRLLVERMSAERLTHFEFNPCWVRVEQGATPRGQITLHSHGKSIAIGQHLAAHRRTQFARELRSWLRRCG